MNPQGASAAPRIGSAAADPRIARIVAAALEEDAPHGDITSEALIPAEARASATLTAREPGVLSGGSVFATAFELVDPSVEVRLLAADGDAFDASMPLARVEGPARAVLRAERVALNFVQRMSGTATLTSRYVAAAETAPSGADVATDAADDDRSADAGSPGSAHRLGKPVRIVDTRKTTPGLRLLERQAVRDGGGHNHRSSLSDAVMAKDNHLAVVAAAGIPLTEALLEVRRRVPHTTHIEVEVDALEQIPAVLAAGVDTIMLDNFTPEQLRAGVALIAGRAIVEASGGVDLDTVAAIASTGVDVISVGALTHGARALDLGLDIELEAVGVAADGVVADGAPAARSGAGTDDRAHTASR